MLTYRIESLWCGWYVIICQDGVWKYLLSVLQYDRDCRMVRDVLRDELEALLGVATDELKERGLLPH